MADLIKGGNTIQPSQPQIVIDKNVVGRTLRNIAAPVFDFFTKEVEPQDPSNIDFDNEIQKYEMRNATTQRILNDSDPNSRTRFNTVI